MMKLLEQNALHDDMCILQKIFVSVAFKERAENVVLTNYLDMDLFSNICDRWKELIEKEIYNSSL